MSLIPYEVFLLNVQVNDLHALALLASGERIGTTDATEAEAYQAQGVRLFNAGVLDRFSRSVEQRAEVTWHLFDGRINPAAAVYVARCAAERVALSREPLPTPVGTAP